MTLKGGDLGRIFDKFPYVLDGVREGLNRFDPGLHFWEEALVVVWEGEPPSWGRCGELLVEIELVMLLRIRRGVLLIISTTIGPSGTNH